MTELLTNLLKMTVVMFMVVNLQILWRRSPRRRALQLHAQLYRAGKEYTP
jgi:hypothetical protein